MNLCQKNLLGLGLIVFLSSFQWLREQMRLNN
jgi:hypothetical protein